MKSFRVCLHMCLPYWKYTWKESKKSLVYGEKCEKTPSERLLSGMREWMCVRDGRVLQKPSHPQLSQPLRRFTNDSDAPIRFFTFFIGLSAPIRHAFLHKFIRFASARVLNVIWDFAHTLMIHRKLLPVPTLEKPDNASEGMYTNTFANLTQPQTTSE